jgi:hypothetical protein
MLGLDRELAVILPIVTADSTSVVAFNAQLNQSRLVSENCNGGVGNLVFQGEGTLTSLAQ